MRSYNQYCAVAKALDVVGDRWTLLIIRELLLRGGCRYSDLQHGLPGIATNLLGARLKELEEHGLVCRESAPPPVATTLYHLTDAGRELEPVLWALGRWGVRFMPEPTGEEAFRSHWLAFPVAQFLEDAEPDGPPAVIEVRTAGDQPVVIEVAGGEITTHLGTAPSPDLVLEGDAPPILGLLSGMLQLTGARQLGLRTKGSTTVLRRLRYRVPS
ncbi:MAG TPA: helix-turn-helix domain-containing protein [Acidimicrobiales bacterium]|nr:helix-turn-helix domain-containing protein [Acidimicrobiales bacterium]